MAHIGQASHSHPAETARSAVGAGWPHVSHEGLVRILFTVTRLQGKAGPAELRLLVAAGQHAIVPDALDACGQAHTSGSVG